MRQIIFVNEAIVKVAPPKYCENPRKNSECSVEKSNDPSEDENITLAYDILNKIRYNTDRIHVAPKKYREGSDPEDVKALADKLGNSAYRSGNKVWK